MYSGERLQGLERLQQGIDSWSLAAPARERSATLKRTEQSRSPMEQQRELH